MCSWIKAKQHYGKIFRGSGHDEPLHDIIDANGTFYYFNRGRYVTGTWRKGKVTEPFEFTLGGRELRSRWRQARPSSRLPDTHAKIRIGKADQMPVGGLVAPA